MARETFRVTFQPEGRNVFVLEGTKVVEAAGQAGIVLNTPCGGEGTCGKCRVEVLGEAPEASPNEKQHLSEEELRGGLRLACQLAIDRDMSISVPQTSRFFEQVVLTEGAERGYAFEPNVRKRFVTVARPSNEDPRSCLDRLKDSLGDEPAELRADLGLARLLPSMMGEEDFKVTVVLQGDQIDWIERGDTTEYIWGLAFDVGTTTIVGTLVNLATGRQEAVASRTNPQVHFGDDVVSRIRYIEEHPGGLDELRRRLLSSLNDIIAELTREAGVHSTSVYDVTVVGNTTMSHIFLNLDPSPIGHAPYVAVVREGMDAKAKELGLDINENASLHTLPNIAGFVGSDTVGVILATGMMHSDEIVLAIDIGTNGEVVLGNRDRLVACSCAAGPAFEGARIRYGMRATEGAISKAVINSGIEVSVIGGGRASGICGSGLIDAVAELLRVGLIEETGRMRGPDELSSDTPQALRRALTSVDGQPAVALVDAHSSKIGEPITLTQRDIREVQLAKAAIRAGIEVLAHEMGLDPGEIPRILLAGGFGNFIRRSNAKRIGLLPPVPTSRIEFVGNAACSGAKMALASRSCRREAEQISRKTQYLELAGQDRFRQVYTDCLMFPGDA